MAAMVAADLARGAVVNLGIGLPTLVAGHVPEGAGVVFHSENGILGMGPRPAAGEEDPSVIDAGKTPVTLRVGASIVHHADSFAVIRGGRLDVAVLGAYQVSRRGDLASWIVDGERLGSIGGAMDLAVGARQVFVIMPHCDKQGHSKVVDECTYPLTAVACVDRIYTDLAVIEVTSDGLVLRKLCPGMTVEELRRLTGAELIGSAAASQVKLEVSG
jgi:3-oxoadipate CoA-transferase, beta subunit